MQGIYCIVNRLNKRKYYGSSKDVFMRYENHMKELTRNIHHNIFMQRDFNKIGIKAKDLFELYIIEYTSFSNPKDLLLYEQTFIDLNLGGYNLAPAGGGDTLSSHPDKELIISKRNKTLLNNYEKLTENERKEKYGHPGELNGMYGKTHTEEVKKKITESNKGRIPPNKGKKLEEGHPARDKISNSKKGKTMGENNHFYGKHHSEETKKVLSEKAKIYCWLRGKTPEEISYTKKYKITNLIDGSEEIVYGLKELAERYKVSIPAVHGFIKRGGIAKTSKTKYKNVKIEELIRTPLPFPYINIETNKGIFDLEYSDIKLLHYNSHPAIKMEVSA